MAEKPAHIMESVVFKSKVKSNDWENIYAHFQWINST